MLAVNVEAALNTALLLVQAPRFVELLRMCAVVELHTAVPPYVQTQAVRFAWNLIAFQAAVALLYVCLSAYSDFGTALLSDAGRSGALVPLLTPLAVAYGVLGTPLVSVMCLSTRLWLMYFSRVIALYLACIHRNLDQCLRSRSTPESRKVVLVDQMRVQLSLLKNCADLASSLLGPSLLYAYAYSVAILCAAAYYTIIPDLQARRCTLNNASSSQASLRDHIVKQ
ncbi:hypothetical protein HPB48_008865 [Haemaphysalis longicornis]|uniref:Uncharacterized protein n=1 Tax=Haemaphysalis longicornis TaxID=44386 RepID=A0A9J6H139_HAELO|nr:hypothetical protein HPB48_008865 [Haemaphysalis longicornis]